ncbi:MAG: hypothetical protein RL748_934 [Pseudomonadota bacterium]|jgi:hypothetical protein
MNKLLIGGVLAVATLLVLFAPEPEDDTARPVVRPARNAAAQDNQAAAAHTDRAAGTSNAAAGAASLDNAGNLASANSLQIKPREEQDFGNLFAAAATPAPVVAVVRKTSAPQVVTLPPGPPQAPPLPFQYLGRWLQDGEVSYFLQLNGRNLVLRVGDTVDQTYKLEQASAGTLRFIYLPLNQQQSMAVGEVN